MDSQSSNLSVDIVEHVLSFLPIPTICRMRVVCKEWNELTNNTTFHALCDKNGKNKDYLFLWKEDKGLAPGHKSTSPRFGATFYLFDLDVERWYSIPTTEVLQTYSCHPYEEMAQRFLNMDNGLLCEAVPFRRIEHGKVLSLSILDLIAKTSKGLPSLDLCFHYPPPPYDGMMLEPSVVIVVDEVTQSYKVFFFNTFLTGKPLVHVLESDTQQWRPIGGLPQPMDDMIGFQNTIFASLSELHADCFELRLFRYQVEGDTFAEVWQMNFKRRVVFSKLVVRHNRLFVLVITRLRRHLCVCALEPASETCFQTCQDEEGALFEMYEILLDKGSSKPVVQFTEGALHAIWGGNVCTDFWFAFPCLDSKGDYSSVILIQHHSGEMRRIHLATWAVDGLPACPLSRASPDTEDVPSTFEAKTMLSLRDELHRQRCGKREPHCLVNASWHIDRASHFAILWSWRAAVQCLG